MARVQPTAYIRINFAALMRLRAEYRKQYKLVYETAAKRHAQYLTRRFMLFSRGGGDWKPLEESTVERKKRNPKTRRNAKYILRALGIMSKNLSYRIRTNGYDVGFVRQVQGYNAEYCGLSVLQLAAVHHKGDGHVPARPVVALPDRNTHRGIVRDIQKGFNHIIREVNKDIK